MEAPQNNLVEVRRILLTSKTEGRRRQSLLDFFTDIHAPDIAELLEALNPNEWLPVLGALDDITLAMALGELDVGYQSAILQALGPERVAGVLDEMGDDDLVDFLGDISPEEANDLLEMLEPQEAEDARGLMSYPDDTAGGLMTTEYIGLTRRTTVHDTIDLLRKLAPDAETAYYIYVVGAANTLVGVLSLRELLIATPEARLGEIMLTNIVKVEPLTDQEEVARTVAKYNLLAVPVVDRRNRMLGIVTVDDILDVIEEEASEDIYRLAATSIEAAAETRLSTPMFRATRRLPWLIFLLFTSLLTASVVRSFGAAIESVVALAYFIPVLAGMGGNVGTQSLASTVRGLAVGDIEPDQLLQVLWNEIQVGVSLGAVLGGLVAFVAYVWQGLPVLGLVVGLAMSIIMVWAALIGSLVPLVFDRVGIDATVASGPFITTAIDITGLFIYFTLATSFLRLLQ